MNVYMLGVERAPNMDTSGDRYEKLDPRYPIEYQGPKIQVAVFFHIHCAILCMSTKSL